MVRELSKVHTGVTLCYVGYVIILLCIIASVFLGLSGGMGGMRLDTLQTVLQVIQLLAILGGIIMFVGKLFCLGAPADMPGKTSLVVSVVLDVIDYAAQVYILLVAQLRMVPGALEEWQAYFFVAVLWLIARCAAFILFLVFFMGLGEYIQVEDVTKRAKNTLTTFLVLVGLGVVTFALIFAGVLVQSLSLRLIVILSALVVGIMLLIQFGNLLGASRKALASIGGGYSSEE